METITVLIEKVMARKGWANTLGFVAVLAPLYFLKTLYVVWFGSDEVLVGFKSEQSTWLVMTVVDFVSFLTLLPARKKGRVMQIVMGMWTIEMFLIFLATIVR